MASTIVGARFAAATTTSHGRDPITILYISPGWGKTGVAAALSLRVSNQENHRTQAVLDPPAEVGAYLWWENSTMGRAAAPTGARLIVVIRLDRFEQLDNAVLVSLQDPLDEDFEMVAISVGIVVWRDHNVE